MTRNACVDSVMEDIISRWEYPMDIMLHYKYFDNCHLEAFHIYVVSHCDAIRHRLDIDIKLEIAASHPRRHFQPSRIKKGAAPVRMNL